MKKIVLTGGGTAGHVTPNIALIPKLIKEGYEIHYIGSKTGVEKNLITSLDSSLNVKYYSISSGKLRRELNFENVKDVFKVTKGILEANKLIKKIKPDVIFSKGGYVVVPVVLAGKKQNVPVIIHESDYTPGLANKIAIPFAKTVCTSFESTKKFIKKATVVHTGPPIREEIKEGNKEIGESLCNFKNKKPVIMLMGGSLGAKKLNETLRKALKQSKLNNYNVIHLTGKGNLDDTLTYDNYKQFDYVGEEMSHLLNFADIVITRGGANAIFELLSIKKPNIIIPLSLKASRGDQIQNAKEFSEKGYSKVIFEEDLNTDLLLKEVEDLFNNSFHYINKMSSYKGINTLDMIVKIVKENS